MDSSRSNRPGPRVLAAILAAGWGRRLGGPKALCRAPTGETFLQVIARAMREAGLQEIVVVVGPWWNGTPDLPARFVMNPDPDRGLASSLRLAIPDREAGFSAVLWTLVDHPAVATRTYEGLLAAHRRDPEAIWVPVTTGEGARRRGHPVVFPAWVWPDLASPDSDRVGPRAVLWAHPERVREVEVSDPGILLDMDTPMDYTRYLEEEDG